jgi:endonuclease/exonuclease/phosphatase family metal-dependent hydrolase
MARQAGECTVEIVQITVLTWNLFHGRSVPPAGRGLLSEFAAALAGWQWDVALLQEVPPWWPEPLAAATGAQQRSVLTSRNALGPARTAVARRRPDLLKANGGGANTILAREAIFAHAHRRIRLWPERRLVHGVALRGGALWVANVHASTRPPERVREDVAAAAGALERWAGGPAAAAVLGGDLNLREPGVPGFAVAASHHVDHVLVRGLQPAHEGERLDGGALSDHAPLRVRLSGAR